MSERGGGGADAIQRQREYAELIRRQQEMQQAFGAYGRGASLGFGGFPSQNPNGLAQQVGQRLPTAAPLPQDLLLLLTD